MPSTLYTEGALFGANMVAIVKIQPQTSEMFAKQV